MYLLPLFAWIQVTFPLGMVALAVPWRLPYALSDYSRLSSRCFEGVDLHVAFVRQFGLSMLDLVLVPLGVVAAFCPWRAIHALEAYGKVRESGGRQNYNSDLRFNFLLVR